MKTRLLHLWDRLISGYWFLPTAMIIAACALAFGMLWVDHNWQPPKMSRWIYSGGASGARALLATVAGSIITVAGVVFSITIATLTQASSQFGPRLLRNFMRDLGNQLVLGTFVATFLYCLLILRAVRGQNDASFVPNLSVTTGVLLAVASLAVLVYFIDHISMALQAPRVVAAVGLELQRELCRPFPTGVGRGADAQTQDDRDRSQLALGPGRAVAADCNGYLQALDQDGLLRIAQDHDLVLRLDCRPGDFVTRGDSLLTVYGIGSSPELEKTLAGLFILGQQRTAEQDVEYPIRQLVEIAVRALSPGINDPFTALNCIDWLGAGITAAAAHGLPSAYRYDSAGKCRVIVRVSTFAGLVDASFNQIRQFGAGSVAVVIRLLEVLANVGRGLKNDEQRSVVTRHVNMVFRQSSAQVHEPTDLSDIRARFDSAMQLLHPPAPTNNPILQ